MFGRKSNSFRKKRKFHSDGIRFPFGWNKIPIRMEFQIGLFLDINDQIQFIQLGWIQDTRSIEHNISS